MSAQEIGRYKIIGEVGRGGIFILAALGYFATAYQLATTYFYLSVIVWYATAALSVLAIVLSFVDAIRSDQLTGSAMGTSEAASFARQWWRVGVLLLAVAVINALKLGYVFMRPFSGRCSPPNTNLLSAVA